MYDVFDAGQGPILDYGLQLLKRSTAVPDDADHPARRWFRRWSLWPPVLELPPWIRWVQASPAYPNHPIAGALIAAAAPLKPWIDLTPSFPKHVIAGAHLVPIGPEGQSALDRGLVVRGNGVRPGAFRERHAGSLRIADRGRETAGALGRRVQAYGGDRRVPHVRGASDVAMVAGSLTVADPGRFKEMTQIYANIGLPRWETTRRAYTEVAWPQRR